MRYFLSLPAIIGASVYVATPAYSAAVSNQKDMPSITDINAAPGPKYPDQDIPSASTIARRDDEQSEYEPLCTVHVEYGVPSLRCRVDTSTGATEPVDYTLCELRNLGDGPLALVCRLDNPKDGEIEKRGGGKRKGNRKGPPGPYCFLDVFHLFCD